MKINLKGLGLLLLFLGASVTGVAQTPDVFRLEYMLMPKNDAEAKLSRLKLVFNMPVKVRESDLVILGSEYNMMNYDLLRETSFDNEKFETFHVLDFNMAYVLQHNTDWRFVGVITPRLSSTLNNRLGQGDFSVNATIGAIMDRPNIEKPSRLVLGVAYNSSVAIRVPLPVVYYEKRFHPNWAYVIGAPKTGLKYYFNQKHMLQTEFVLDGYYVNLQNTIILPESGVASSISTSAALAAIGYQYSISKNMFVYGYVGHTMFQDGVLRDENRNEIFTLNDSPSLYFRSGFRIGI
ncbi:hypothetical protein SAMN04487911_102209 [Arenibacter nanhaiticus]|uniref:DUF6268 domain-containing protein n=1 Tax=Arenibacter nanhaiticus TaxID=558155 RepID=A0A1M6BHS7_9FLAO|nr:DUF6268 family outer membrane beta-barrel protein [Arenibacter nanhaiticus]SHI48330.1 hypothetical protein SAMN04487911_102209 [Arenibacter nanhaiticus]